MCVRKKYFSFWSQQVVTLFRANWFIHWFILIHLILLDSSWFFWFSFRFCIETDAIYRNEQIHIQTDSNMLFMTWIALYASNNIFSMILDDMWHSVFVICTFLYIFIVFLSNSNEYPKGSIIAKNPKCKKVNYFPFIHVITCIKTWFRGTMIICVIATVILFFEFLFEEESRWINRDFWAERQWINDLDNIMSLNIMFMWSKVF